MVQPAVVRQQKPRGTNNLRPALQKVCYMKYLPDPAWRTRCLRFDNDAYANLHQVRVTNEGKGNKIKGFKSFDKCFYSFEQAKCWGVRLTIKLLINIQNSI